MKKLIPGRIQRTTEAPLTLLDRNLLLKRKHFQLASSLSIYLVIAMICLVFGFFEQGMIDPDNFSFRIFFSSMDSLQVDEVSRLGLKILFILSTLYIGWYCYKRIHDFNQDIHQNRKFLLYFPAIKKTGDIPDRFYIETPMTKPAVVQIHKELFDSIREQDTFCLEWAENSHQAIRITRDGQEIEFD